MPRVVVVEDHALLAETLRAALEAAGVDCTVVTPAPHAGLLRAVLDAQPDLVLLDLDLGGQGDSTPLIGPLREAGTRVLVVTGSDDRLRIATALEQGAVGYRSKADGFASLLDATRAALASSRPFDPEHRLQLLDELYRHRVARDRQLAPFRTLTQRESATLQALCQGRSVAEIAADWVVSEATVRSHVKKVLDKLGVRSQLAAVGLARSSGWLGTDVNRRAR